MTKEFQFELILPDGVLFSGAIVSLVVPAVQGEMTVLAYHAPLVALLLPGIVTAKFLDSSEKRFVVFDGFLDISVERSSLLSEDAKEASSVSLQSVEEKIQKIHEILAQTADQRISSEILESLRCLMNLKNSLFNSYL